VTRASDLEAAVGAYVAFYDSLTADSLDRLEALCAADVRFRDPFNDVRGVAAYRAILARMFEDVTSPRFTVKDWALSGRVAYLRWDFAFLSSRDGALWHIEGMSEVHFDSHGRVAAHLDHWDSGTQFYGRLPLLRHVINLIRKRLAVGP
jgi:predicted ester cyclase